MIDGGVDTSVLEGFRDMEGMVKEIEQQESKLLLHWSFEKMQHDNQITNPRVEYSIDM